MTSALGGIVAILLVVAVGSIIADSQARPLSTYEIVFEWKQLDFQFDSDQVRQAKLNNSEFIPANNVVTGIKLWGNRMFLSVPRWRSGVPSTLNYVDYNPNSTLPQQDDTFSASASPKLIPYPNWEMQAIGHCDSFQYVDAFEIDQFNRMWVIDVGRINIFGQAQNKCPPKLVIIDLETNEVVRRYEFPEEVVSATTNFLKGLTVGCYSKDDCWAYVTDAYDAKVVVYTSKISKAWAVKHSSMAAQEDAKNFTILGHNYIFDLQSAGIILSPLDSKFSTLYYCPLTSFDIFSIDTAILQKEPVSNGVNQLEDSEVTLQGTKSSQSNSLTMDSHGLLFYGLLGSNSVNFWNTSTGKLNFSDGELVVRNDIDVQWPDAFSFDGHGYLYVTTNRLQIYSTNNLDPKDTNFRVLRMFIGTMSYMHPVNEPIVEVAHSDGPSSGSIVESTTAESSNSGSSSSTSENYDIHIHPGGQYDHVERHDMDMPTITTSTTNSPARQSTTTKTIPSPKKSANKEYQNNGSNKFTFGSFALVFSILTQGYFNFLTL